MRRLSDVVAALVERAIADTEMMGSDREDLEWEVTPALGLDSSITWLVGIGLPVRLTGDSVMPFGVLADPHSQEEAGRLVKALYRAAVEQAAQVTSQVTARSNGHRESAGGLVLP